MCILSAFKNYLSPNPERGQKPKDVAKLERESLSLSIPLTGGNRWGQKNLKYATTEAWEKIDAPLLKAETVSRS